MTDSSIAHWQAGEAAVFTHSILFASAERLCYALHERELLPCPLSDNPLAEGTVTPDPRDIASDWRPRAGRAPYGCGADSHAAAGRPAPISRTPHLNNRISGVA